MPDMQSATPPAAAMPPMELSSLSLMDDTDVALGFECAYPTLQIERWQSEARAADAG